MSTSAPTRTTLTATPDWAQPETWLPMLAAYLNVVPADAPTTLALQVGADVPADVVTELLTTACDALAPDGRFADVVLDADPAAVPADAVAVATAADVCATVGVPAPAPPAGDEAVVAHARWAKDVLDATQQVADRWRFETTPEPDPTGQPLVTVRIALWGDVTKLLTVALPSVLNGTWRNVEVLLCSDGPQPHAREAVAKHVSDPRVRYLELPERPVYPTSPWSFWRVAGIPAVNRALDEAEGQWIAPLDHDDAFTRDHIERLVLGARRSDADFVYGQAMCEHPAGGWEVIGSAPLAHGHIAHGAVLYSQRLRHMRLDPDAWLHGEPGDWNMWRRIAGVGAAVRHQASPVVMHFRERSMLDDDERIEDADRYGPGFVDTADLARDVLATGARRLLDIARRSA